MELTELMVRIIILLLPGIFGTFFLDRLHYKESLEQRTYLISVIMIGFTSYFLLFLSKNIIEIFLNGINNYNVVDINFFKALIDKGTNILFGEVLYSTIIGTILGIIIANIINKGYFYNLFRKLKITNSTGQDVWAELFDNNTKGIKEHVFIVDIEADRVYGGWVDNYSKSAQSPELLLSNVIVTTNETRKELYELKKMYLKFDKEKMIIEIQNETDEKNTEFKKVEEKVQVVPTSQIINNININKSESEEIKDEQK